MNDNSLPKPAQTPTFPNPGIQQNSTPAVSSNMTAQVGQQTNSPKPTMPGFIPATTPVSSPPVTPSATNPSIVNNMNPSSFGSPLSAPGAFTPKPTTSAIPSSQPPVPKPIGGGVVSPSTTPAQPKSPLGLNQSAVSGQKPPLINPAQNISNTNPLSQKSTPNQTTQPSVPPSAPKMASPKKSVLQFLPFILIGVGVLAVIGFIGYWFFARQSTSTDQNESPAPVQTKQVNLQYWGLWEPTTVMQEVISDFESQNPGVKITYTQQSPTEYRERLQTSIATGKGPDVFRFHASWTPMLKSELASIPEKIMTSSEFEQTFYPVATQQLTLAGQKVGIPLMYDGLGLYYNKQIFSIANENPPKTWEDVKRLASELTIKSGGKITRGGIALGTASNVEHYSDIIGLMMLQNGADPLLPSSEKGQEALSFYSSFAKTLGVWDDTLPSSTTAFSRGDVVMMLAPSWRAHEIKAKNPNLEFGIVPVPQLADTERTTWASYWAEGVSAQSSNKDASWIFLKYLSSSQVQKKLYSDAKKVRAYGEIYSRVDLGSEIANDEYVGAYIQDAPFAKSSYLNAYTHDNGINDRISKYYFDAITAMSQGSSIDAVLTTLSQGISQVLQQYGFQVQQPATQ